MARERLVTRKIVENRTMKVYSIENGNLTELETITVKGKVSEKDFAKKHGVQSVVFEIIDVKTATYGMLVDDFMKHATRLD